MKFSTTTLLISSLSSVAFAAPSAPKNQCIANYSDCFDSQNQPLGACCDGLICVANKCRDPKEITGGSDNSNDQCVTENHNCFDDITGQPVGTCCDGLICAANRCRDPKKEKIKPPAKKAPEVLSSFPNPLAAKDKCLEKYGACVDDITGQFIGTCCEGLICAANRCRDPKEEVAKPETGKDQCIPNYSNCYDGQTGQNLGACCEGLICVADKCRDPKEITGGN